MDKNKSILIIVILIAIIIAIAGMIMLNININNNNIQYETLQLSDTCALSVPVSNNSTIKEDDGFKSYNDTNLQIISYNKNELGAWENLGANIGLIEGLNQNFKYNHTHQGKNILIHPEENKTVLACLITNNTTGDVIVVMSQNEEILYHVIDSVNFTVNNTNTSANVTTTKNATTTDNTNAQEETSTTNNQQDNQEKIEFNGKTHSQNVQAAKESRDQGGQWAGASDEEIERLISQDEKNGGRI